MNDIVNRRRLRLYGFDEASSNHQARHKLLYWLQPVWTLGVGQAQLVATRLSVTVRDGPAGESREGGGGAAAVRCDRGALALAAKDDHGWVDGSDDPPD
jgi:hypothetical protein